MIVVLTLVVGVLVVLLVDTRMRLSRLERGLLEWRNAQASQPAPYAPPQEYHAPQEPVWAPETPPVPERAEPVIPVPEPTPVPVAARHATPQPVHQSPPLVDDAPAPATPAHTATAPDRPIPAKPPKPARTPISFEDLFGRKLPIWAGGITLLVAAILLVKWSIDAGLLSPTVRVLLGLAFSGSLIGGAELARRKADVVQDDRVAQALAGAGIGGLYAAILAAANLYGLIGAGVAFVGLSAVTALAMGLAIRFGVPSAVLGLVGGLATPALVQAGEPNVPLLSGYLAITLGALTLLSRRQNWMWLGVGALVGGGVWTLFLIVSGIVDMWSTLSVGLLILFLGIALPFAMASHHSGTILRGITAVIAALQLAILVAMGGFSPLTWGLYGLLSLAFIWLSERAVALRVALFVPLIVGLILLVVWPDPTPMHFSLVLGIGTVLYGGIALWRVWRSDGGMVPAGQLALAALGGDMAANSVQIMHPPYALGHGYAWLALLFALLPFTGVLLGLRHDARAQDNRFPLLAMTGGALIITAALIGLAPWSFPVAIAAVAAGLLALGRFSQVPRLTQTAVFYLGIAALTLSTSGDSTAEFTRLAAEAPLASIAQSLLRWAIVALCAGLFAYAIIARKEARMLLQGAAALLTYGAIAQVAPTAWMPVITALGGIALIEIMLRRSQINLFAAIGVSGGIIALWMAEPIGLWVNAALQSLFAMPMLVTSLPALDHSLLQLLIPALLVGLGAWRLTPRIPEKLAPPVFILAGAAVLVALHILYKQVFYIADMNAFIAKGLAERSVWQALLLGVGVGLWRFTRYHRAAGAAMAVALLHALVYSWGLHNPLWAAQNVEPWPIANLLIPAAAIVLIATVLLPRAWAAWARYLTRPLSVVQMVVVALFAYTELRQLFAGPVMVTQPIGAGESIGWSIVTIALALGYLGWGIVRRQRDWRIASLLLMLAAVAKVFLIDAAGLEGLLRIASFLALGFSLIGIGWLYSRFLRSDTRHDDTAAIPAEG